MEYIKSDDTQKTYSQLLDEENERLRSKYKITLFSEKSNLTEYEKDLMRNKIDNFIEIKMNEILDLGYKKTDLILSSGLNEGIDQIFTHSSLYNGLETHVYIPCLDHGQRTYKKEINFLRYQHIIQVCIPLGTINKCFYEKEYNINKYLNFNESRLAETGQHHLIDYDSVRLRMEYYIHQDKLTRDYHKEINYLDHNCGFVKKILVSDNKFESCPLCYRKRILTQLHESDEVLFIMNKKRYETFKKVLNKSSLVYEYNFIEVDH